MSKQQKLPESPAKKEAQILAVEMATGSSITQAATSFHHTLYSMTLLPFGVRIEQKGGTKRAFILPFSNCKAIEIQNG